MSLIKYGIGFSYLPNWGVKEALREIYQNFKDFGDYEADVDLVEDESGEELVIVTLSSDFDPKDLSFLQVGKSGKREDSSTIGEHGEGLKMAMMVLLRLGYITTIQTKTETLTPTKYVDEFIGECFGINVELRKSTPVKPFQVTFICPEADYIKFHEVGQLKDSDIIFKDSYHGSIIDKNPGDIYVGGLFVCNLEGYKHAFDFPPARVSLDRDRRIPSSWDVEYHSNNIMSAWKGITKTTDLLAKECAAVSSIPEKVASKFKPKLVSGKIKLIAGSVIANKDQERALLKNDLVANRVVRLKASIQSKKKPETLLSEWYERFGKSLSAMGSVEFRLLLRMSKDWK